jgi:hypothetical protein
MTTLIVQFADESEEVIVGYMTGPMEPPLPNTGEVEASDSRWKAYYNSLPEFVQPWFPAPE